MKYKEIMKYKIMKYREKCEGWESREEETNKLWENIKNKVRGAIKKERRWIIPYGWIIYGG